MFVPPKMTFWTPAFQYAVFVTAMVSYFVGLHQPPDQQKCATVLRPGKAHTVKWLHAEPESDDYELPHKLKAYGYATKFVLDGCDSIMAGHATEKW